MHPELGFCLYELDRELYNDSAKYTRYFDWDPTCVTKFTEPYSKRFYTHISNPGWYDLDNRRPPGFNNEIPLDKQKSHIPYCDVFSSSSGIDLHIPYTCQATLKSSEVPFHIRVNIIEPAIHNLVQQLQLIDLSRKGNAALQEMMFLAHEKNVNLFVRYSSFISTASKKWKEELDYGRNRPFWLVFNTQSCFLDLQHSYPISHISNMIKFHIRNMVKKFRNKG